jgi:hypothetical protein
VDFPIARTLPLDNTIIITVEPSQDGLVCQAWGDRVL